MESMVWEHSTLPAKQFKTAVSIGKVMTVNFWDIDRSILIDFTPCDATVTAVADKVTLQHLKEAIQCWRPGLLYQSLLLLHDNARLCSVQPTTVLLNTRHWECVPNPPCSPSLGPSNLRV
jgi:hypothetical protein